MPRRRRPPRAGAIAELPPLRILGQIAALQAIYYTVAIILMAFTSFISGIHFNLDMVFGWASLRGDTTRGWMFAFVWLCCAATMVVALVVLIGRSKLILDFALTLHCIHLLVVFLYTGFLPRNMMWWFTMAASSVATVFGGIHGCRWRELRPISFGGLGIRTTGEQPIENGRVEEDGRDLEAGEDEEAGYSMGRGRGRGRDGGGTYEMVGMKGDEGRTD